MSPKRQKLLEDDLQQIYEYISKDNPSAASRVVTRLIDPAMTLRALPTKAE